MAVPNHRVQNFKKQRTKAKEFAVNVKFIEQQNLSALATDVDTVFQEFMKLPVPDFKLFCEIFTKHELPTIFIGQFSVGDMVEVSGFVF